MCGIVASIDFDGGLREDVLREMTSALSHRGPDGLSIWKSACGIAGLGHTRLAIIDLETGDQPIHSDCGRYSIVLNGEIYNYRQLREELTEFGCTFRTKSDTEVLLAAYVRWGEGCLLRLNGMFAFAIFDSRSRSLFVARDRVGIKPLYIYQQDRRVIVASEIKALLADRSIPRKLNPKAVADLLVLSYCQAPNTFYDGVQELAPGTSCLFAESAVENRRYWAWNGEPIDCDLDEAVADAKNALVESVSDHLVSDVPVGAFLSSGIDSSLVTSIAVRELGYKLRTFTVGFEFEDYDESSRANRIAKHLGTDHQNLLLSPENVDAELLLKVLRQFDQPFGDSSAIPTYILSSLISDEVNVVLSGDGGDEMFGGYPRFHHADLTRAASRILGPFASVGYAAVSALRWAHPRYFRAMRRMVNATTQRGTDRLTWFASHVTADEFDSVLSPALLTRLEGYRPSLLCDHQFTQPGGAEFMDVTVKSVLPSDYLKKVDIASGAHGIEVRVPFLGNQVLDYAAALAKDKKFKGRHTKIVPRKLLRNYLPRALCELPKSGFSIPLMRVLSAADRRFLGSRVMTSKELVTLVSYTYIHEITRSFVKREWNRQIHSEYMIYQRFYALLALVIWIEDCEPDLQI